MLHWERGEVVTFPRGPLFPPPAFKRLLQGPLFKPSEPGLFPALASRPPAVHRLGSEALVEGHTRKDPRRALGTQAAGGRAAYCCVFPNTGSCTKFLFTTFCISKPWYIIFLNLTPSPHWTVVRNCLIVEKDPWVSILFSADIFQEDPLPGFCAKPGAWGLSEAGALCLRANSFKVPKGHSFPRLSFPPRE